MTKSSSSLNNVQKLSSSSALDWEECYTVLRQVVRPYVYGAGISSWYGQEYDLIEDIVQESVTRVFVRMQEAEQGLEPSIITPNFFSRRVAFNYFQDLRRKDARLIHPPSDDEEIKRDEAWKDTYDPMEAVLDEIGLIDLLQVVAQIIVDLPNKQRLALLIDLANHADCNEQSPSHLQQALLAVGIQLAAYQGLSPTTAIERSRHAASLSIAYKRVRQSLYGRHDGEAA